MLYKTVEAQFLSYVDSFMIGNEEDDYHYLIKKEHSIRVQQICAELCKAENFSEEITIIATVTALLHDIGRFEQFKHYKTFRDDISIDHGRLGAKIIDELDILELFDPSVQTAIKHAIIQHNQITWEAKGDLEDQLTKIVRDSDKLDIYNVIATHMNNKDHSDVVILHLPNTEEYSKEIIEDIYEGKLIPYSKRKTFHDMKLTILNWLQDMNYSYSFNHVLQKDYINIFCDTLPDNPEIHGIRFFFLEFAEKQAKTVL